MEKLKKFNRCYLEDGRHEDREARQQEDKDAGDPLLPGSGTKEAINN